jgi:hypothetical protein
MNYVEFFSTVEGGKQILLGSVVFSGSKIGYLGLSEELVGTIKSGIRVAGGKKLLPKDGMRFLEGLKHAFSGSYLRASEVKEGVN